MLQFESTKELEHVRKKLIERAFDEILVKKFTEHLRFQCEKQPRYKLVRFVRIFCEQLFESVQELQERQVLMWKVVYGPDDWWHGREHVQDGKPVVQGRLQSAQVRVEGRKVDQKVRRKQEDRCQLQKVCLVVVISNLVSKLWT